MKKVLSGITACLTFLLSSCCIQNGTDARNLCQSEQKYEITHLVGTPVDYSNKDNWMYLTTNPQHEVDLFFFYPTVFASTSNGKAIAPITDEYKKVATQNYKTSGSAFSSYTNVFVPFYRQASITKAQELVTTAKLEKYIRETEIRTDIYAALDTYFAKYNHGRPFIIGGFSQGSAMTKLVLAEYMKAHPEYLARMVAAYPIGFPITKPWLKENSHLKFAKGETDTGVIVSWNTEGPDSKGGSDTTWMAINPLNWKLDETPATVQENKGSLNKKTNKIEKGQADATVHKQRGTLICTTNKDYGSLVAYSFGEKNLHFYDYPLYYVNIKENGLKRIEAYLGHKVK